MLFVIPFVPLTSCEHDLKPLTAEAKRGVPCEHHVARWRDSIPNLNTLFVPLLLTRRTANVSRLRGDEKTTGRAYLVEFHPPHPERLSSASEFSCSTFLFVWGGERKGWTSPLDLVFLFGVSADKTTTRIAFGLYPPSFQILLGYPELPKSMDPHEKRSLFSSTCTH